MVNACFNARYNIKESLFNVGSHVELHTMQQDIECNSHKTLK